jgi:hypothetical protein
MRFIVKFLLMLALGFVFGLFMPYWSIALAGFLTSYLIYSKGMPSLGVGLLAGGLLWFVMAYTIDTANAHVLSARVGELFKLSSFQLVVVTGFLGAVLGGLGSLAGSHLKAIFRKR